MMMHNLHHCLRQSWGLAGDGLVATVIVSGLNFSGRWAASYTMPIRRDANSAKVAKAVKSSLSPWF